LTSFNESQFNAVRRADLRTFQRSRQHGQLLTAHEVFQHDCPLQISPIDRRSTISAVSMRDALVDLTRKSTADTGTHVLANDRPRRPVG
jgi:hypothetical protein